MADITIDSSLLGGHHSYHLPKTFWTNAFVGYTVFVSGTGVLSYRKTTDGGLTWAGPTALTAGLSVRNTGIWYDRWTPGHSGTKLHIIMNDVNGDDTRYRSLDSSNDSLSAFTSTVLLGASIIAVSGFNLSVVRAKAGNLYASCWLRNDGEKVFARSTDEGANWTARAHVADGDAFDYAHLVPANLADGNDIWAIYWDKSVNELDLKTYDESANTWTSGTSIATGMVENDNYRQLCYSVRHSNGHIFLAAWSQFNNAAADLRFWEINGEGSIVERTNILTNTSLAYNCDMLFDQARGRIYVCYVRALTDIATDGQIRYKFTNDFGTTWSNEFTLSETDTNLQSMGVGMSIKSGESGRFQPVWFNDALDDLITNNVNSLLIPAGGGGGSGYMAASYFGQVEPPSGW